METTRRGIEPLIQHQTIKQFIIRQGKLRWTVPAKLKKLLPGLSIESVSRRAKYLLLGTNKGHLIVHLGMSGSLRVVDSGTCFHAHDRVAWEFTNGRSLRLRDVRRFGAVLWTEDPPEQHRLLASLGPEPLGPDLTGELLFQKSRNCRRAIRDWLLDGKVLAGVGNIYANEALFHAGIRPTRATGRVSRASYDKLARSIKRVLRQAIKAGGTTLRDFQNADGRAGYFQQKLVVYGRDGQTCHQCGSIIKARKLSNRRVFYCTNCQL